MSGFAWVTLATNDSYSLGALVLAHSLKHTNTPHKMVVLITPSVSQTMRNQLQTVFDLVKSVEVLDSKDEAHLALLNRPELGVTFTKLHCWKLTEFEKCVFLDADTLVVKNCDDLFEREELSAAPDFGWPDCFNSGVFVFKPSEETFEKILQFAIQKGSYDGGDQGLLNQFFRDWSKDINKHLPFVYNLAAIAAYSYYPAFKQFGSETRIVHFIGTEKPWLQKLNPATKTISPVPGASCLTPLFQKWWDIFCEKVHPTLDKNLSGITGAIAQLRLESTGSSSAESAAVQEYERRLNWETGNVDYMGKDSFDNIWAKICQTIEEKDLEVKYESGASPQETGSEKMQRKPFLTDEIAGVALTDSNAELLKSNFSDAEYIEVLPTELRVLSSEDDDVIFSKTENRVSTLTDIEEEDSAGCAPSTSPGEISAVSTGTNDETVSNEIAVTEITEASRKKTAVAGGCETSNLTNASKVDTKHVELSDLVESNEIGKTQGLIENKLGAAAEKSFDILKPAMDTGEKKADVGETFGPSSSVSSAEKIMLPPIQRAEDQATNDPKTLGSTVVDQHSNRNDNPTQAEEKITGTDISKDDEHQKKGVFTKILEIVGVSPKGKKENNGKTSNSIFYDVPSVADRPAACEGAHSAHKEMMITREISSENQEAATKDCKMSLLISCEEAKVAEKVSSENRIEKSEGVVEKVLLKSEKEAVEKKGEKRSDDPSQQQELNEPDELRALPSAADCSSSSTCVQSEKYLTDDVSQKDPPSTETPAAKGKPSSPKLSILPREEQSLLTSVTEPTPPIFTDVPKDSRNPALLTADENILNTPPVTDATPNTSAFSGIKGSAQSFTDQKILSEVKEIPAEATTEVECRSKGEELASADVQDSVKSIGEPAPRNATKSIAETEKKLTPTEPEKSDGTTISGKAGKTEVEELKVTSPEERQRHKGEATTSKLSDQILKAIPPPRRKAISESKTEGSSSSSSSSAASKPARPSAIPVPPPRSKSKPSHPAPPKGKTNK